MKPTSGKHSASSSGSPPDLLPPTRLRRGPPEGDQAPSGGRAGPALEQRTLFIDRCAWSTALGRALGEGGIGFIAHHERFSHDTPDEIWLSAAADKSWLVVTRDQRIRYRANELAAMQRARLHVFVFTQGGLTAAETGSILVRCHAAMMRQAAHVAPPAFFSLTRSGEVKQLKAGAR